jgi:hypothetical protein
MPPPPPPHPTPAPPPEKPLSVACTQQDCIPRFSKKIPFSEGAPTKPCCCRRGEGAWEETQGDTSKPLIPCGQSPMQQFGICLMRNLRSYDRISSYTGVRVLATGGIALLLGSVFWNIASKRCGTTITFLIQRLFSCKLSESKKHFNYHNLFSWNCRSGGGGGGFLGSDLWYFSQEEVGYTLCHLFRDLISCEGVFWWGGGGGGNSAPCFIFPRGCYRPVLFTQGRKGLFLLGFLPECQQNFCHACNLQSQAVMIVHRSCGLG